MGGEISTPGNMRADRADLFERVVATKLRKTFDDTITSVIDDLDFSEEVSEVMTEIVGEIISEKGFRASLKKRVMEIFAQEEAHEKFAQKIVEQMLSK